MTNNETIKKNPTISFEEGWNIIKLSGEFFNKKKFYAVELGGIETSRGEKLRGVVIGGTIYFLENGYIDDYAVDKHYTIKDEINEEDLTLSVYNSETDEYDDLPINKIYSVDGENLLDVFVLDILDYSKATLVWERKEPSNVIDGLIESFCKAHNINEEEFVNFVTSICDTIKE